MVVKKWLISKTADLTSEHGLVSSDAPARGPPRGLRRGLFQGSQGSQARVSPRADRRRPRHPRPPRCLSPFRIRPRGAGVDLCSVSFSPNPLYSTCWCSALRRDVFVAGRPVRRRMRRDSGRPGRSCGGAGATGPLGRELPYKTREPRNTKSRGATTRPNPHPNRTIRTLRPCLPDVPPHDTRPPPRLPPFYPCGGTGCTGVHLPPFLPDPKVERAGGRPPPPPAA